jgi:exopolysaccharide production protein ExoQ
MEIMQNATVLSGPRVSDQQMSTQHVARLVVSWILMIPLLFFAVAGAVRFNSHSRNDPLGAAYTSLLADSSAGGDQVMRRTVFLLCALLFVTMLRRVAGIAKNNQIFPLLAILAVISTLWSQFPEISLSFGIYAIVNVWFAYYLVARFDSGRQLELFMTLGWVVILASITAALWFPQYGIDHQGGDGTLGAWIGIFPHKNWCSVMVVFLLSGAFYLRPKSQLSKVGRAAYITLSLVVIIMSQSRTGWIVCGCLLLYVASVRFVKRWKPSDRWFIIIAGGGAAVAAALIFAKYYTSVMLFVGKDPTLTGRTKIWSLALAAAMRRPLLGYGYRAFWHGLQGESATVVLADGWIAPAAHNGVLDLWLGLGLVGVGLFAYSIFQAVRNGVTCLRGGDSPAAEWFLCIIWLTIASNVAELTLMVPDDLAWIMYVLACVGLSQEATRVRLRTA